MQRIPSDRHIHTSTRGRVELIAGSHYHHPSHRITGSSTPSLSNYPHILLATTPTTIHRNQQRRHLWLSYYLITFILLLLTFTPELSDRISVFSFISAAATPPSVYSISPTTIAPASFTTITILGSGFNSNDNLFEIQLVETATSPSLIFHCTNPQRWDDTKATCIPGPDVPAAHQYFIQVNVSHILSTVPSTSTSANTSLTTLNVDCYASTLCSSCWLTPPDNAPVSSSSSNDFNLSHGSLLAIFIIGGICTTFLICLLGYLCRRAVCSSPLSSGLNKVAQTPSSRKDTLQALISTGQRQGTASASQSIEMVKSNGQANGMLPTGGSGEKLATSPPLEMIPDTVEDAADDCVTIPSGVMISYSHANTPFALQLEAALVAEGFTVWIDTKITPGEDWRANIAEAIELSFAVVAILSPTSVTSKYCKEELYYAAQTRRAIFPIVHLDCWSALKGGLKMLLQRIQWLHFERDSYETCFPKLVNNLKAAHASQLAAAKKLAARNRRIPGINSLVGHPSMTVGDGHRLQPLHDHASHGSGDLDDEEDEYDEEDGHANLGQDLGDPEGRIRLPELVSHDGDGLQACEPGDVYICVDAAAPSDIVVSTMLANHLREHGLSVYVSQHPQRRRVRHAAMDGRSSPMVTTRYLDSPDGSPGHSPDGSRRPSLIPGGLAWPLPGEGENAAAAPPPLARARSRRPSAQLTQAQVQLLQETTTAPSDGDMYDITPQPRPLGFVRAPSVATKSPIPLNLPADIVADVSGPPRNRRQKSIFAAAQVIETTSTEDCFEANASHIDASTMMIFIASAISFKSADCTDELHYAYEVSKPMLQIRNDAPGHEFHSGLLHGSVGMMLQQVPSVHWETDGQAHTQLTSLFHVLKHKLRAERKKKKAEAARNRRLSAQSGVKSTPPITPKNHPSTKLGQRRPSIPNAESNSNQQTQPLPQPIPSSTTTETNTISSDLMLALGGGSQHDRLIQTPVHVQLEETCRTPTPTTGATINNGLQSFPKSGHGAHLSEGGGGGTENASFTGVRRQSLPDIQVPTTAASSTTGSAIPSPIAGNSPILSATNTSQPSSPIPPILSARSTAILPPSLTSSPHRRAVSNIPMKASSRVPMDSPARRQLQHHVSDESPRIDHDPLSLGATATIVTGNSMTSPLLQPEVNQPQLSPVSSSGMSSDLLHHVSLTVSSSLPSSSMGDGARPNSLTEIHSLGRIESVSTEDIQRAKSEEIMTHSLLPSPPSSNDHASTASSAGLFPPLSPPNARTAVMSPESATPLNSPSITNTTEPLILFTPDTISTPLNQSPSLQTNGTTSVNRKISIKTRPVTNGVTHSHP